MFEHMFIERRTETWFRQYDADACSEQGCTYVSAQRKGRQKMDLRKARVN